MPPGIDGTTGERRGVAVDPTATVTLALPTAELHEVGEVVLADIGLTRIVCERAGIEGRVWPFDDGGRVRLREKSSR